MVFLPTPSPTARQSAGAAGTFSKMSSFIQDSQWAVLGYSSMAEWVAAGRPSTPKPGTPQYESYLAQERENTMSLMEQGEIPMELSTDEKLKLRGFGDGPLGFVDEAVDSAASAVARTILESPPAELFGEGVSQFIDLPTGGPSPYMSARGPTLGQVAATPIRPIPELEAAQEFTESQAEEIPILGKPLGLASELLFPTTPLELGLLPTSAGTVGDIADIGALGRGTLDLGRNLGESAFRQAVTPEPNVIRVAVRPGATTPVGEGLAGSRGAVQVVDPSGIRILGPDEAPTAGETLMFHGTAGDLRPGGLTPDTFLTPDIRDAETFARTASLAGRQEAGFGRRLLAEEGGFIGGGGNGEPDALTDIVNAINDASRQADELRRIQDEMFREQRGQQFGRMEDALSENLGTGFDAFRAAREAGVGRFERPQIDIPKFSYDDLRLAFDEINMFPDMHPGQKIRASEALESLLINREPPEPYAFNQLRTVFPNTADEILEAVRNQYGLQPNLFDEGATTFPEGIPSETPYSDAMIRNIGEARANLGRATTRPERTFFEGFLNTLRDIPNELRQLVAGMDFSNALRQGLFTIRHTPSFMSDLYIGGRAMVDEKFALGYQALLKSRDRHGLFLSDLPGEPGFKNVSEAMARREENYSGQVVSKVLPYKMTGRGNTLFLNARRAHVYDLTEQAWDRPSWLNNVLARPGDKEALANYVNRTTGRGTLGPLENTWVESVLGFGLFSPKYLASRPQAFFNLFNFAHPRVQVEAIKDFTATFGATAALLGLANESSLAEVELDPTSSDFGKFRAGPIRVDPWAGFQQLATAAARVYSGASDPEEILPVLERFLRSKLAPFPGTAYSFLMKDGRDIIGRQIGIKELATSFLPIFIQSLYEGAQEGLMGEALSTLPAEFFGLGAQVYNRPEDLINQALLTEYPELTDREGRPISTFEEFRQNYPDLADQFRNQHMNLFEEKVETASAKVREDFALIQEYKTAQEARDQNFAVDPARWRSESQAQARALGVLRHNLWKDADFREENRGPLDEYRDMYHEQIEAATDPETKIIDWDKVDEWLAAQDAETQQFIFESGLEHETDLRKQYLRDVRELVPYWNMRDKAWRELTKDSETYSQYKTMDEAIQARAYQFVQEGADWTSARNLAEKQLDSITEAATNESYQYLDEHRELIPLLNKYDYYIPAFFRKFVQQ